MCSIIYNSRDSEAVQVPIGRWVDKKGMVHLHNGILLGHKKEGNLTFCKSMDGPREYYAKWNKPVRERQVPFDFTYKSNLMNKINKENRNKLIENGQLSMGRGDGRAG